MANQHTAILRVGLGPHLGEGRYEVNNQKPNFGPLTTGNIAPSIPNQQIKPAMMEWGLTDVALSYNPTTVTRLNQLRRACEALLRLAAENGMTE